MSILHQGMLVSLRRPEAVAGRETSSTTAKFSWLKTFSSAVENPNGKSKLPEQLMTSDTHPLSEPEFDGLLLSSTHQGEGRQHMFTYSTVQVLDARRNVFQLLPISNQCRSSKDPADSGSINVQLLN